MCSFITPQIKFGDPASAVMYYKAQMGGRKRWGRKKRRLGGKPGGEATLPLRAAADCQSLSGNSIKSSLNSSAASGGTSVNYKLKNKLKLADICCVFLHLVIKATLSFFFFLSWNFLSVTLPPLCTSCSSQGRCWEWGRRGSGSISNL